MERSGRCSPATGRRAASSATSTPTRRRPSRRARSPGSRSTSPRARSAARSCASTGPAPGPVPVVGSPARGPRDRSTGCATVLDDLIDGRTARERAGAAGTCWSSAAAPPGIVGGQDGGAPRRPGPPRRARPHRRRLPVDRVRAVQGAAGGRRRRRRAPGARAGSASPSPTSRVDFARVMDHVHAAIRHIAPVDSLEALEAAGVDGAHRATAASPGQGALDVDGETGALPPGARRDRCRAGRAADPGPGRRRPPDQRHRVGPRRGSAPRWWSSAAGSIGCELGQGLRPARRRGHRRRGCAARAASRGRRAAAVRAPRAGVRRRRDPRLGQSRDVRRRHRRRRLRTAVPRRRAAGRLRPAPGRRRTAAPHPRPRAGHRRRRGRRARVRRRRRPPAHHQPAHLGGRRPDRPPAVHPHRRRPRQPGAPATPCSAYAARSRPPRCRGSPTPTPRSPPSASTPDANATGCASSLVHRHVDRAVTEGAHRRPDPSRHRRQGPDPRSHRRRARGPGRPSASSRSPSAADCAPATWPASPTPTRPGTTDRGTPPIADVREQLDRPATRRALHALARTRRWWLERRAA